MNYLAGTSIRTGELSVAWQPISCQPIYRPIVAQRTAKRYRDKYPYWLGKVSTPFRNARARAVVYGERSLRRLGIR